MKELKTVSQNQSDYFLDLDKATACFANFPLKDGDFLVTGASAMRWNNIIATGVLGTAWLFAFTNQGQNFLYDIEKGSPLLALTGSYALSAAFDNHKIAWEARKFTIAAAATMVWWCVLCLAIKPQESLKPWDLLSILFPVTAGLTKRFVLDPGLARISGNSYTPF